MAAFSFEVPQCEPGSKLKVKAPDDNVTLHIPVPENVRPGDEMFMVKGEDGNWRIDKVVRPVKVAAAGAAASSSSSSSSGQWRSAEDMARDCDSAEAVGVALETTKGVILLKIVPSWSPLGAQRFLQLVDDGYFQDIAIYRAIEGGLLQFGVVKSTDPRAARYSRLADDLLQGIPYAEGVVSFAAAGPGTRKSTVCIMKADFRTQLGKGQLGTPSTETPIGMVSPASMSVMHSITCLGDIPQCGGRGPDPAKLEEQGNDYIRAQFPTCDFVLSARRA